MKKKEDNHFLEELYLQIDRRVKSKKKNSYSNFLLKSGSKKIAQKILKLRTPPKKKSMVYIYVHSDHCVYKFLSLH